MASAGIVLLIDWRIFVVIISVFAVIFTVKRIVSIGSICSAISFPISNLIINCYDHYVSGSERMAPVSYIWITTAMSVAFSAIIIYKHKANITRIRNGTEKTLKIKLN